MQKIFGIHQRRGHQSDACAKVFFQLRPELPALNETHLWHDGSPGLQPRLWRLPPDREQHIPICMPHDPERARAEGAVCITAGKSICTRLQRHQGARNHHQRNKSQQCCQLKTG